MVINRDKHNKFFTIVDNTKPQGPTDNQGLSSGDNGNTGSSSGSTGGNTTIIYQGGGMTEDQNNKLNGIEEGAEKNQDAFSYITIQGATSEEDVTLSADDPTDTFKLAAKDSVTLTLEDDVITIGCDGVKYLKELLDVDALNPLDEDLLIYNSETEKWEAINPLFATIEWVNELFDKIIGSAPEVLDTIYEIAEALGNDPDYVKDIANNLSALTNRVTITELDITDIKSKLLPTNFTDLTSGLLLQYDGLYWVNVDKDAVGLNEDLLLEYLTTNNYAKKSDITWSNLIGKPSIYATNIANITDLNSGWDSLLANAPTKYITRWPNFSEIGSKPTTLVGYGITDGVNSVTTSGTGNVITGATVSGHVLTLNKGITAITSVSLATINDLHANWDAVLKVAPTKYVTRWPSWAEVTDKPDWIESDKPSYSWSEITGKPSVFATNIANITDLHSTWDAVLKATKPNWLTIVSLATITDLQANWDAILKVAPTSQVTRWPTWAEVTSKPSTLSGYGITDGVNAVSVTGSGNVVSSASISGHTLTLNKGITALTSVSIATISDLHSSWDAVLKALKPAWLTSVSLATISDLNASWDALLKAAPSAYVTRWPTAVEVGALTQTTADGRYLRKNLGTIGNNKNLNDYDGSGLYLVSSTSYSTIENFPTGSSYGYGILANFMLENGRGVQWYIPDHDFTMAVRTAWNVDSWQNWHYLLTNRNYTSYTVTRTGGGASGTWGIGISGNAATASKWATARTLTLTGAVTGSVSIDGSGNVSLATTYATGNISALDTRYVKKSGDTMTGALTFQTSTQAYDPAGILYENNSGRIGCSLVGGLGLYAKEKLYFRPGWTSSSSTTYGVVIGSDTFTYNSNKIWHAGNDGSGSGLDADLLDGTHKSGLLTSVSSSSVTNLSIVVGGTTKSVADLYATYASQLLTSRTLWGRPFNGTANVSGALSGVTDIAMTGEISGCTKINMHTASNGVRFQINTRGAMFIAKSSGAYANSISLYTHDEGSIVSSISGVYGLGNTLIYTYYGGTYNSPAMVITPAKNVGIGTTSPSYKLHVAGTVYSSSTVYAKTGLYSDGYVSAKGQNTSSDLRLKNKISDIHLSLQQIAAAPSMLFSWKESGLRDVGSSAQYWKNILPDAVKERDGWLEMGYGNIALVSVITVARELETVEEKIKRLERENMKLKQRINQLERRIAA